jgi:hypothetical protein
VLKEEEEARLRNSIQALETKCRDFENKERKSQEEIVQIRNQRNRKNLN